MMIITKTHYLHHTYVSLSVHVRNSRFSRNVWCFDCRSRFCDERGWYMKFRNDDPFGLSFSPTLQFWMASLDMCNSHTHLSSSLSNSLLFFRFDVACIEEWWKYNMKWIIDDPYSIFQGDSEYDQFQMCSMVFWWVLHDTRKEKLRKRWRWGRCPFEEYSHFFMKNDDVHE